MSEATKRIGEIRDALRQFVLHDEGEALRAELHQLALKHYVPKHSDAEYMAWICKHLPSFDVCGAQEQNSPYVLRMFAIVSQHVGGDCVQECLDKAMDSPPVVDFEWRL